MSKYAVQCILFSPLVHELQQASQVLSSEPLWFIHDAVTMTPNIKFKSSNLELLTLCSSQTCKCLHSNYQGLIFDVLIY